MEFGSNKYFLVLQQVGGSTRLVYIASSGYMQYISVLHGCYHHVYYSECSYKLYDTRVSPPLRNCG